MTANTINTFDGGDDWQVDGRLRVKDVTFVSGIRDLPRPNNGVIHLRPDHVYLFTKIVNLRGFRLQGYQNTVLAGFSPEISGVTSEGLAGAPLYSNSYTAPVSGFSFRDVEHAFNLDATGNAGQALDWISVNVVNCPTTGTIKNYSNFVAGTFGLLNSANLTFDGTIGTVAMDAAIETVGGGDIGMILADTLTITRRFRAVLSAMVVGSGKTGIQVQSGCTIPQEGFILDVVSFSGGGTYLDGIDGADTRALIDRTPGVLNSTVAGHAYMNGNTAETPIAATSTPVKIAGTFTAGPNMQRFTLDDGELVYTGSIPRVATLDFQGSFNVVDGANNQVGVYLTKNGTIIPDSEEYATSNSAGRGEGIRANTIVTMATGDRFGAKAENKTAIKNIIFESAKLFARGDL